MEKQLEDWLAILEPKEAKRLLGLCIEHLVESEEIRFGEYGLPYWTSCGEDIDCN